MSKEVIMTPEKEVEQVETPQIPFAESLKEKSNEDLESMLDSLAEESQSKKFEIKFSKEDIQFVKHLLNTIPFKAMEAYVLLGVRNSIGDQTHKEFSLDSSAMEALWHLLVNKFEGRGVKEAMKFKSTADKLAPVMRELQEIQKRMQEIGAELNNREQEKIKAELEANSKGEEEQPKPKKRGRKKKSETETKVEEK